MANRSHASKRASTPCFHVRTSGGQGVLKPSIKAFQKAEYAKMQ